MVGKSRVLLKTPDGLYRKLFWVRNSKPNEMLLGLYGLKAAIPTLQYQWPEREIKSDELPSVRYEWKNKAKDGTPVDHVTCHASGAFHVKACSGNPLYIHQEKWVEALGSDTPIFLNFILCADVPTRYETVVEKPTPLDVVYEIPQDQYINFRAAFSGMNFPLEEMVAHELGMTNGGPFCALNSGSIKGVLLHQAIAIPDDSARQARPEGTLLSFRFRIGAEDWRLKTFNFV